MNEEAMSSEVPNQLAGETASQLYVGAKPYLDGALETYSEALKELLVPLQAEAYVSGRVKSARSLIRKLRKDPSNPREWASITDKVGLRVICSSRRELKAIDKAICDHRWVDCKREKKSGEYNELFYPGVHITVDDGESVDHRGEAILCEIQVRTRAQDAWSVVSHKLMYKGVIEPPRRMKRVINRLTVVVEMFDDEVHRMFKRRERLPMYEAAIALELLDDQFERILGEPTDGAPDLDIMNILLNAYTPEERGRFNEIVSTYCAEHRDEIREQLIAHQPASPDYMEARDWLFTQPEIIAILERSRAREALLVHAVERTDLAESVRKACSAIGRELPFE